MQERAIIPTADVRPFEQMVEGVAWVSRLVNGCHGHGKRWMNRAYDLGGQALGLPFPVAKQAFEDCAFGDVRKVALELRDMLVPGAAVIGDVYFAQDQRSGSWKVGFSTDAERRVAGLANAYRMPLILMATKRGVMLTEHWVHSKLMPARIGNEWFKDCSLVHHFVQNETRRVGRC